MAEQYQSIVAHYMQQIKESAQSKDCVYRGQANAEWPLRSGAERRMRKALKDDDDDEIPSDSIKSYHDDLLDKARERGFGRVDGSNLNDLELLAALQHFGAATCLIDFTKQALVALYFACQPENEQDGKIFNETDGKIFNKKDGKIFIVPDKTISPPQKKEKKSISKLLESDKPLLWRPMLHGAAERRIMTQSALFLINITDKHEDMQHVIISKEDKNKILEELDYTYQISAETLFMDLSGFAQNQTADKAFSDHLTYIYNGIINHKNENLEEAIKDFDEAIRLEPGFAEAYRWRGMAKDTLKQYKEAIEDWDEAIRLEPDYVAAYWWRGMAKDTLKQHEEAIKDFNEAIRLKPDDADAYWGRGVAKCELKQHEEAIKDFDKAIRLKPDDADAYLWRGRAKHQLEQYKEAIKDFDEAIRLKPDDSDAYWGRGLAKYELGMHGKAIKHQLEQYKEAIKDFDEAIRLEPDDADAYRWRGLAWSKFGDNDKACSDLRQALKLAKEQGKQELVDKISVDLKELDF